MAVLSYVAPSLLASSLVFASAYALESSPFSFFQSPDKACQTFAKAYPNQTFVANSTSYVDANTAYYSESAWLYPACVFEPTSSEEMSYAVTTLTSLRTQFAIRGGGHMPIANAANINSSGVLITAAGLTQLELSEDQSTVNVGPGNRWGNVYEYLEPYGLTVVGGRMGVVGVPGYVLGGGISFFSNEYGWASANVASFTVVLADGSIVKANATGQYSDLYWALRGGGNSFGIVTNFELNTIVAPGVTVGQTSYNTTSEQFLDSVYNFAINGCADSKSAVTPIVRSFTGSEAPSYAGMLFYNGNDPAPTALENFTSPVLNTTSNTFSYRTMYNWTLETDAPFPEIHGLRERFYVLPITANREGMQIIHDTYFEAVQTQLAPLGEYITGVAFMPICEQYIVASTVNGGDPQDMDVSEAPYIWVEESISYSPDISDATIDAFYDAVNANITSLLAAQGIEPLKYLYLNDANEGQPVWQGYPAQNVAKLLDIRQKYDPNFIYTYLMPGGWKVFSVVSDLVQSFF